MVRGWEKQPHFVVSSPFSTLCPPHSLFVKSLYYVTFRIGETVLYRNESIEPSPPDLQEGEGDADGKAELLVVW